MRSTSEIREQMDRASDCVCEGTSKYFGMTYEEGVEAALRWVLEHENDPPMPDEGSE